MSTSTQNYGITKPETSDYYDIAIQNANMDKIDAQMKANADAAAAASTAIPAFGTSAQPVGTSGSAGVASTVSRSDHVHALPAVTTADNTSSAAPSDGGTFTAIDSVTTDGYGRVTAKNTKTVTLPAILSKTLSGLSTATNAVISASDTILSAFGKLQAQITAHMNLTSSAHGATNLNTPSTIIARDSNGRAQVSDPSSAQDIATKKYIDNAVSNLNLVGTLQTTMRNDLGNSWALCNGAHFDYSTYPDLSNMIGHDMINGSMKVFSTNYVSGSNSYQYYYNIYGIKSNVGGYDIIYGERYYIDSNGTHYSAAIGYARSNSNDAFTWADVYVYPSVGIDVAVCDIIWDGTGFVAIRYSSAGSTYDLLKFTSITSPQSTTTAYNFSDTLVTNNNIIPSGGLCLLYQNGYYVITWNYRSDQGKSCYISYSTQWNGGWNFTRLPGAVNGIFPENMFYVNNIWVIVFNDNYITYCTTPAPTSFSTIASIDTPSGQGWFSKLKYLNNMYVGILNDNGVVVYNTTMSATGWKRPLLPNISDIDYDGDYWIAKISSNLNTMTIYDDYCYFSSLSTPTYTAFNANMFYVNGQFNGYQTCDLSHYHLDYDTVNKSWKMIGCGSSIGHRGFLGGILPLITNNGEAYSYIKVLP